jgi:hypothetical protein
VQHARRAQHSRQRGALRQSKGGEVALRAQKLRDDALSRRRWSVAKLSRVRVVQLLCSCVHWQLWQVPAARRCGAHRGGRQRLMTTRTCFCSSSGVQRQQLRAWNHARLQARIAH